jgi:hypothetical protein
MITFDQLMESARRRVKEFDELDSCWGYTIPRDAGAKEVLNTAIAALNAGITSRSMDPVADAIIMLEDLLRRTCAGPAKTTR